MGEGVFFSFLPGPRLHGPAPPLSALKIATYIGFGLRSALRGPSRQGKEGMEEEVRKRCFFSGVRASRAQRQGNEQEITN